MFYKPFIYRVTFIVRFIVFSSVPFNLLLKVTFHYFFFVVLFLNRETFLIILTVSGSYLFVSSFLFVFVVVLSFVFTGYSSYFFLYIDV